MSPSSVAEPVSGLRSQNPSPVPGPQSPAWNPRLQSPVPRPPSIVPRPESKVQGPTSNVQVYNLGSGTGTTVLEAIKAFERATGQKLNYRIGPRRPGDVEAIYANNGKAAAKLGWQPRFDIDEMMRTAWLWEQKLSASASKSACSLTSSSNL